MRCASAACVMPPNAVSKPIGHAKFPSRSSDAVITFMMPLPLHPPGWCCFFGAASLGISRQVKMHNTDPTNAEIRSSKVILISPRPKSMWSNRKMSPPTTAPTIPMPTLDPQAEASLAESHETSGQRSGQCSDNQPDNDFTNWNRHD